MRERAWPALLYLVRHGESAGNVARDLAEAQTQPMIDVAVRDVDVPLSTLGERQADALGSWLRALAPDERPSVVLASPYLRARETARRAAAAIGPGAPPVLLDERLREKEFGVLDGLTKLGVRLKYPEQAERRAAIGKFYYRPPGGESWCDVVLRLRGVVDTLSSDFAGERVLVVAHQVVVHGFRYVLEGMTEEQILAIDKREEIANCSVTSYALDPNARPPRLSLRAFNFAAPLEEAGTAVTTEPDAPIAPKG